MPLPNTKQELADWILRRLGAPVINIEVADVQLEDCIDEAVRFYQEYHYDGAQRSYRTIPITDEIMNGNNRRNRAIAAPFYDINRIDQYRVGDKVTTYDENQQPDAVWVKFDSEEKITQRKYFTDSTGPYFLSENLTADPVKVTFDSDWEFVTYDSDLHNVFEYTRFIEVQDQFYEETRIRRFQGDTSIFFLDGIVWDNTQPKIYIKDGDNYRVYNSTLDSENGYDSEFYFRAPWIDSDGTHVEYDSDKHVIFDFNVDTNGAWVDTAYLYTTSPNADSDVNKVLYDSDTHVNVTYVADVLGDYVYLGVSYTLYDSENYRHTSLTRYRKVSIQPIRYTRHYKKPVSQLMVPAYDSDTNTFQFSLYGGSDIDFVVSGLRWFDGKLVIGNIHTLNVNQELYFYRDSDQTYYNYQEVPRTQFDSDVYYLRHLPTLFLDSDGTILNYDSDKHIIPEYNIFTTDSDPLNAGVTLWVDSENLLALPTTYRYDSDINKVVYDSDKHTTIFWDSEAWPEDSDAYPSFGWAWVDSDGEKVLYDSDRHNYRRFDSERFGRYIYNGLSGNYELIDSDLDSDGLQIWDSEHRFERNSYRIQRFVKRSERPILYTRQTKIPDDVLIKRRKRLTGTRYNRVDSEIVRTTLNFLDMWKKESAVVTEPTLNIDYSKDGQIGVPVPDDIIAVTKVFRVGQQSSIDMYNYEYQLFLNNFDFFYGGHGGDLTNYYTTKMNLEHIDFMLNTQPAIRFNKHKDRLYIDMDWRRVKQGEFLVCEVYEITDPEIWGKVYQDIWLKKYATALVKQQWGTNLRKYENVELPGGIVLSGQALYDEAVADIEKLEEEIKNTTLEMDSILIG